MNSVTQTLSMQNAAINEEVTFQKYLHVVLFSTGHLDSRSSIRHVLLATSFISLAFSSSQAALEVLSPDDNFKVANSDLTLFGHGGMLFWFISSVTFTTVCAT